VNKYLPLTLSLLALSLTPAIANASSAHIGYESVSISSVSLKGFSVSGSLDISDDFSLELWSGSVDTTIASTIYAGTEIKVQLDQTEVGVGYNTKLGDTTDLKVFTVRVNNTFTSNWSGYTQQADGTSIAYGASLKTELTDNVDGLLGLRKSTESGSNMSTMFGISVGISESMDLTVSSSGNSTLKSTAIGLRYNF
jgi:hypothetical protein